MTLQRINAGVLDVAYEELGPYSGHPLILLHGFPYDVHSFDDIARHLAGAGRRVIVPYLRGFGPTRFLSADVSRLGQQTALGLDLLAFMNALKLERTTLAGYDWGGRAACVVTALHPERVVGLVSCGTGYNIQNSEKALKPSTPDNERRHWYWFYLSSERGRIALTQNRTELCKYLWQTFSPSWHFDERTYLQTAASFSNPDFAAVVLHSYRYRIGAAAGDPALEKVEKRLASSPPIHVPTIVLEGSDDGVDPPALTEEVAMHFPHLRRRTVLKGVGHNVPQESPKMFVEAILELQI